jgi:antitoxin MazE
MATAARDKKNVIKIRKWGHSLGLRIPSEKARSLNIQDGTSVTVQVIRGQIVVQPERHQVPDLATLVKRTKLANRPTTDDSAPVGRELL